MKNTVGIAATKWERVFTTKHTKSTKFGKIIPETFVSFVPSW